MLAIKCGKLNPVTSPVIEQGILIVNEGKIIMVGDRETKIPDGTEIFDATDQWVYPGFIEASSHIGANRQPSDFTNDLDDGVHDGIDSSNALMPHLCVKDSINAQDNTIKWVQSSGITTCFVAAGPGVLIDGQGIAVKIKPAETTDEMIIPGSEQMCFTLGDEMLRTFARKKQPPVTRMGSIEMLRDILGRAKTYREKAETDREKDAKLEALIPIIEGSMTARFECLRADDIVAAVKLSEEFGLKYMIVGAFEGHKIKNFLVEHHVPVVLEAVPFGPERCMPMLDKYDFSLETAAVIEQGKNLQAITVNENGQTRRLPILTGFATAYGLAPEAALECITIRAARQLGLDQRIGSLEKGKDADIAVFNGDALCNMSRCTAVIVDGKLVYQE